MPHRKLLVAISIFHASMNTLYLVRFFGIIPPEDIVYGYAPWFMSFALPNATFALLAWFLAYALIKKRSSLAAMLALIVSGGLVFHALNGFMFLFYSGSISALTPFNAVFEVAVYVYGLALAAFYITQSYKFVKARA